MPRKTSYHARSARATTGRPSTALVADLPGADVYPAADFRVEWGPIFHRGRLDGTARVLVLGQDPATHETIAPAHPRRRGGPAGPGPAGARLGITTSYVMVNTFLYSVYGQGGGGRHAHDPAIAATGTSGSTPCSSGTGPSPRSSRSARWPRTPTAVGRDPARRRRAPAPGRRPAPDLARRARSARRQTSLAAATAALLATGTPPARAARRTCPRRAGRPASSTATRGKPGDLVEIPAADLPAGAPAWWRSLEAWADRTGPDAETKRATITVTVPTDARPWH